MNRPLNVLVLDDNPKSVLGTLNLYLEETNGSPTRFKLESLSDPARLNGFLDAHPGKFDVVLVDVDFELAVTPHTCLTAFQTLIRRNGPKAVGLAQSHHGRALFPFAVCQLLPPPPSRIVVGWAYKDDKEERGYPELLRILDAIASGSPMAKPRSLAACMPDADPDTGQFMDAILPTLGDARLWALMSSTYYDSAQLADGTSFAKSTITKRFRTFATAIEAFEKKLRKSSIHPVGSRPLDGAHTGKTDPNQRIVSAFAETHRIFFQAPELEEIVKARTARRSKLAGRRARRRAPEPWWKPHILRPDT